jgi:REP element-mobilizing transposase RayT
VCVCVCDGSSIDLLYHAFINTHTRTQVLGGWMADLQNERGNFDALIDECEVSIVCMCVRDYRVI